MAKFQIFTLLHGATPDVMRCDHSVLSFSNTHEAHLFALRAAFMCIKEGASKVEIDMRRKSGGPNVIRVVKEAV